MKSLPLYLTLTGTLPVFFCTFTLLAGVDVLPVLGNTRNVLAVYCLLIVSFMAGSLWGHQSTNSRQSKALFLALSNIIAVAVWLAYLSLSHCLQLLLFSVGFLLLLAADKSLLHRGLITEDYFTLRIIGTSIVLTNFLIVGFFT
ncbi:DUF3429 domain-containing protein [Pseudoteredinibacter isoporae]|uniref:DUF3429 domain-containing protein n=1 Tax=Pseudoteredinibacter isoporae TaxID=570281 RepID=A0A7X0JQN0_9GAMM|nr:DUF3429 domain-containing protein [Pseudoteredinibacter isoporae]MBB6520004.1 hypothetical protein [Pseudoteredinibacter isoporae]NHO85576.1 DUF3429 domain-containing protein [Pseudoteredinibacter isoporae]NIB25972.1 DUF3429 domain-containing protein [Pseudoteredinibacter isoporae]